MVKAGGEPNKMSKSKGSTSVDLDKIIEVSKTNPENTILMIVTYLKLKKKQK